MNESLERLVDALRELRFGEDPACYVLVLKREDLDLLASVIGEWRAWMPPSLIENYPRIDWIDWFEGRLTDPNAAGLHDWLNPLN